MPTFPILTVEPVIQENDKSRLDGSLSYGTGGDAIAAVAITPSVGDPEFDVTADQYLDWQYDFEHDVALGVNDAVEFLENGGAELSTIVAPGKYSPAALADAVAAAMNSVSGPRGYSASVSALNVTTITNGSSTFRLLPVTGSNAATSAFPQMGLPDDTITEVTSTSGTAVETITRKAVLKLTDDSAVETSKTFDVVVISEVADGLFSTDARLRKHETDIMRYLADGRASFKDIHRRVQILIVDWLNKEGHGDNLDNRLTRKALLSVDDFGLWADYLALQLIFEDNRKAVDDVFAAKAKKYEAMAAVTRSRVAVAIDTNGDGVADVLTESVDIRSCRVMRR